MPDRTTRWRATATSFGPAGKILLSIALALFVVLTILLRDLPSPRAIVRVFGSIWRPRYEDG